MADVQGRGGGVNFYALMTESIGMRLQPWERRSNNKPGGVKKVLKKGERCSKRKGFKLALGVVVRTTGGDLDSNSRFEKRKTMKSRRPKEAKKMV